MNGQLIPSKRITMKRPANYQYKHTYTIEKVTLSGDALSAYLFEHLEKVMAGSADPTIKFPPTRYVDALFSGRLGDFQKRVILKLGDTDGMLIAIDKPEGMHITTMGVKPEERRKGMVKAMLNDLCTAMNHQGTLILNVHTDNLPAYRLYQQLAFKEEA